MAAKGRMNRFYPNKRWKFTENLILSVLIMLTLILLMLLTLVPSDHPSTTFDDQPSNSFEDYIQIDLNRGKIGLGEKGEPWTEMISWQPRSVEECQYLINKARPNMTKSEVMDDNGDYFVASYRTSSGMFFNVNENKVIANIEDRIAEYTFIPVDHGEGLQMLHYDVGQKYDPHTDFFDGNKVIESSGQRVATFLMYLSDVEEGGETVFPKADRNFSSNSAGWRVSECAKIGLSVKPKMGDAILFWDLKPEGTSDQSSLHAGCPVIRGNKWSCTKWMHVESN